MSKEKEVERKAITHRLAQAAKEEMKKWKKENGIRAIVPKTENQKIAQKNYIQKSARLDRIELRQRSHGAASEVRHIKSDEK